MSRRLRRGHGGLAIALPNPLAALLEVLFTSFSLHKFAINDSAALLIAKVVNAPFCGLSFFIFFGALAATIYILKLNIRVNTKLVPFLLI